MSTGLTQQLAGYGDVFAAEVDVSSDWVMENSLAFISTIRLKRRAHWKPEVV